MTDPERAHIAKPQPNQWMRLMWLLVPILFWWVLRQVPLADVWQLLSNFSVIAIALLLLVRSGIILVLSTRWRIYLRAYGYPIHFLTMAAYNLVGFGFSYFTPGPQWGGEPLQVYLIKRRHGVPTAEAIAALALDKLIAMLSQSMLLLLGISVIFVGGSGGGIGWRNFLLVIALVALPLGYLILIWQNYRPLTRLMQALSIQNKSRWQAVLSDAEAQIGDFCRRQTGPFWRAAMLSFVIWPLLLGLEFWLTLYYVNLTLTASQVLIVLAASRVAMFLPVPAGLGVLEASLVLAMQMIGADPATGIALSLIVRARDVLMGSFGVVWGTLLLNRFPFIES